MVLGIFALASDQRGGFGRGTGTRASSAHQDTRTDIAAESREERGGSSKALHPQLLPFYLRTLFPGKRGQLLLSLGEASPKERGKPLLRKEGAATSL